MCKATTNIKLFIKDTKVGEVGNNSFFGHKIVVEPGNLYVFTTGVMDQQGQRDVYRGGEIIYVNRTNDMLDRRIVVLNENAGRVTVHCNRTIAGVSAASDDSALVTVTMNIITDNPSIVVDRYGNQLPQVDTQVADEIEKGVLNFMRNSLAIWSQPEAKIISTISDNINRSLGPIGLKLLHENTHIVREYPARLKQIHAECRTGDLRLKEEFEMVSSQDRVSRICDRYPHIFESSQQLDVNGEIKVVSTLAAKWLASAYDELGVKRGQPFFDLICSCIHAQIPKNTLNNFVIGMTNGIGLTQYIDEVYDLVEVGGHADTVESSKDVVRNTFA
jgi:hypothetical protein